MGTELQVNIVTPQSSAYTGRAAEVVLPAWNGELGVLPDHDTLLCLMKPGKLTIRSSEGDESFVLGRGFAEIGPDRVTVLTESCEAPADIDRDQAQQSLSEAHAIIAEGDGTSARFANAISKAEHEQARLDV